MERNKKHLCYEKDGNKWIWGYNTESYRYLYCTNDNGDGIFLVDQRNGNRKQLVGTCQFSLRGIKNPKAKIRKWMEG